MNNDQETLEKYIDRLPQELSAYVANTSWSDKLVLINQKNHLTDTQSAALKTQVFLVLILLERLGDLRLNIQKNIPDLDYDKTTNLISDLEKDIFSEIKQLLLSSVLKSNTINPNPSIDKTSILHEIENPTPTNIILDAQHNLPEQEKKILISSGAVPSRGPMLGNVKSTPAKYTVDPYRERPE